MNHDEAETEISYDRPPITEAVIERRFSVPLSSDLVGKLRQKFENEFQAVGQLMEIALGVDGPQPQMTQTPSGFRLVNKEGTAILVLTNQAIAYARLAPYPGWTEFSAEAARVFKSCYDILGYVPLGRIGVRYINRLDIPVSYQGDGLVRPFQLGEYILVRPDYPEGFISDLQAFTMQCVFLIPSLECLTTINVASVISPVPNHIGFLFDVDIGRNSNVPKKDEEIQILLNEIRKEKNRIFNSCLTDKMKEMFN